MGSLPALSILKGQTEILFRKDEHLTLHRIFEHTLEAIENLNNNNDKFPSIHGISVQASTPEIIYKDTTISVSQLNEEANQLARAIQQNYPANSNGDGDTVVVVDLPPSPQLITTLLAIWKLEAAYLPLDAGFPNQRVQHILGESQPALIIAEHENPERYSGQTVATFEHLKIKSSTLSTANLSPETIWGRRTPELNRIAIILYTSGSTGVPKGVRLQHRIVLNRLKWQWKTFPYSATEKVALFKTALTFVDSVAELWGPLITGRSLVILNKSDIIDTETFVNVCEKFKIERLVVVPTLLRSMLLYIGMATNEKTPFRTTDRIQSTRRLEHLKLVVSSGEVLPVALAQKFYQYFPEDETTLLNYYGSTEVMGDVLYYPVHGVEKLSTADKIPIGLPLDNTIVYILDKHFRAVNIGEVGELYVSGLNIAAGYVAGRDPDKFLDNPLSVDPIHATIYRTGDYARIEKGVIYYESRTDSQIKVRGHKVDLSEVDAAVGKVAAVDKFVVLCYKAGQIEQALLTFVTPKEAKIEARSVEEELERLLPPYMVPQVVVVPDIPLLVNGKVDRQFLLKQYENDAKHDTLENVDFDYSGLPQGSQGKAKALFETVALTLGHSLKGKISAGSNYYHLGGNSLNSVLAVTKLRDLGYVISIGEFITANTMLDIVLRMHEEESTVGVTLDSLSRIPEGKYTTEILKPAHKEDTIRIITESFYEKGDLESWLAPYVYREDYRELIDALWSPLLEQRLSFLVKNADGLAIAVSLSMDGNAEPEVSITSKLITIFEFLDFIEIPIRESALPKGTNQVMHGFMMGTASEVSAQQNIELMLFMEHENLKLARQRGFAGIFTTNTSPLTQQLGTDVYEYKVLNDYQINKYTASDGTKPFGKAPNRDRAQVSWKAL